MDSSITSSPGNGDVKLQWHSKLETREEREKREKLLVYLVCLVHFVEITNKGQRPGVAVGTLVAQRPPHRSEHAELPHSALASGYNDKASE